MGTSSHPANAVMQLAVAGLGAPLVLMGAALLLSAEADEFGTMLGLGLLAGGGLMGVGGLHGLYQWWQQVGVERREAAELRTRTHSQELARWRVTPEQLASAAADEWRSRVIELVVIDAGLVFVGLCAGRGDPLWLATTLVIASLITAGGLLLTWSRLQARRRGHEVVITTQGVWIGADNRRFDGMYRLDEVTLTEAGLSFTIGWEGREGARMSESVLVPVPAGREADARAVVAFFSVG